MTDLPISALLYSHNHADHITDASVLAEQIPGLRIIATEATAGLMERLGSNHPEPTEVIDADTNTFSFEDLTVRVVPLEHSGHARDHAIYVPEGTGVIHVPDLFNPISRRTGPLEGPKAISATAAWSRRSGRWNGTTSRAAMATWAPVMT